MPVESRPTVPLHVVALALAVTVLAAGAGDLIDDPPRHTARLDAPRGRRPLLVRMAVEALALIREQRQARRPDTV